MKMISVALWMSAKSFKYALPVHKRCFIFLFVLFLPLSFPPYAGSQ